MNEKNLSPSEKLLKAAINGSLKGVKKSVEEGADVNAMDSVWGTPLYIASQNNHPRIARYLLNCPGIDILKGRLLSIPQGVAGCVFSSSFEEYNHTPLYAALIEGNISIMRMILTNPDKDKYLEDKENWESLIQGTFNYMFSPTALAELLNAAKPYPMLYQFTIDKAKKIAKSWNMKSQAFDAFIEKLKTQKRLSREDLMRLF